MDLKKWLPTILFVSVGVAGAGIQVYLEHRTAPPPQEAPGAPPLLDAKHAWLNPPMQMPPAGWPEGFKTGSTLWVIRYAKKDDLSALGCAAMTDFRTHVVTLPSDRPAEETRPLLLHELLHVAIYEAGGSDRDLEQYGEEEQFVNPAAPQLLKILRDNPDVASKLLRRP